MFAALNIENLPHSEIADIAAEVGIDWSKARDLLRFDSRPVNNPPVLEKSYEKKSSFIAHENPGSCPVIHFRTFAKGGFEATWVYKSRHRNDLYSKPIRSPLEIRKLERQKQARASEAADQERRKESVHKWYLSQWNSASPAPDSFPYLQKKGISAPELRIINDRKGTFLAIPMYQYNRDKDTLSIVGIERIYGSGEEKLTAPGGRKGFYLFGSTSIRNKKIFIAEGWTKAKIIHQLTGIPTMCSFGAGGIKRDVEMLIKYNKPSSIVICADNDSHNQPNANNGGMLQALELNYTYKIKVRFPCFKGIELDSDITPKETKDFEDLVNLIGSEETLSQLTKAKKSILRSPADALGYRLKRLELLSNKNRQKELPKVIAAAISRNFDDKKIKEVLGSEDQNLVDEVIKKSRYASEKRCWATHTVNGSRSNQITTRRLPLTRGEFDEYIINDRVYESIQAFEGIVIIKAPMGSGKTERIIAPAIQNAEKACYLSHRISLTEEASERIGIASYRDLTSEDMYGIDKLGCCVNSLNNPKFNRGDWFLDCDVVCIDEGTKVFSHMTSGTVKKPDEVVNTLLCAIESSKQVIICDADANNALIDTLKANTSRPILLLNGSAPMEHVQIQVSGSVAAYDRAFNLALNGKKTLIATDTKNDVKRLQKAFADKAPHLNVLGVHSETKVKDEVSAWIKNPNQESHKWDVIIYNGCVDSGISITTDHFEEHVGIFRGVISPVSIIQMLGRDRTARHWFVGCSPIATTVSGIGAEKQISTLKDLNLGSTVTSYDSIKALWQEHDLNVYKDYVATFLTVLKQKGYEVSYVEEDPLKLKELKKYLKDLGSKIKDEFLELLKNTERPDRFRYRKLKNAHAISEQELAEVIIFELKEALKISDITEFDLRYWIENRDRKELNFELIKTDEELLNAHREWEKDNVKSLTQRKHLIEKSKILKEMFSILGIDPHTGEGVFTHENCLEFVKYIQQHRDTYNTLKVGPYIGQKGPKCVTKFVKKILEKLGLSTVSGLYGSKRLSGHQIDKTSWIRMQQYYDNRSKSNVSVSDIPHNSERHFAKPRTNECQSDLVKTTSPPNRAA